MPRLPVSAKPARTEPSNPRLHLDRALPLQRNERDPEAALARIAGPATTCLKSWPTAVAPVHLL